MDFKSLLYRNCVKLIFVGALFITAEASAMFTFFWIFGEVVNELRSG